jgi:hypothetical protein
MRLLRVCRASASAMLCVCLRASPPAIRDHTCCLLTWECLSGGSGSCQDCVQRRSAADNGATCRRRSVRTCATDSLRRCHWRLLTRLWLRCPCWQRFVAWRRVANHTCTHSVVCGGHSVCPCLHVRGETYVERVLGYDHEAPAILC